MASDIDWSWCRSFLGVMRTGSLSAAARQLGVAHPTIRRHILDMERRLGASLFIRSPSGLKPTEAALAIRQSVETMEAAADHLVRTASAPEGAIAGTVRITASDIMGAEVLPTILSTLKEKHPGIGIELALSDRIEDMLRHDADIAVRMLKPSQGDLVARRVGSVELGFYATKDWVARYGIPQSLPDLVRGGGLAGYDKGKDLIYAIVSAGASVSRSDFDFRSDSTLAQLAAVRAGFAAGIVQVPLAKHDPRLVRLLPRLSRRLEIWLTTHPDLRNAARVKVAMACLAKGLAAYAAERQSGNSPEPPVPVASVNSATTI